MSEDSWINQKLIKIFSSKKINIHKSYWTWLLIFSVMFFLILVVQREIESVLSFRWQFKWSYLLSMAIMHHIALITMFIAWHKTIRRLVGKNLWLLNLRIFSYSILARRIPLPIWYVGSRLAFYKEENISRSTVLTATALEIVLITLTGIFCFILLLPWYDYTKQILWWPFLLVAILALTTLIVRPLIVVDVINLGLRALKRRNIKLVISRKDLLLWGTLYLATWFIDGLGFYFIIITFAPIHISMATAIGISTISALVAILTMILPSGFGLKELTIGALLSVWIPLSAGIFISFFYRLAQTIVEILWVIISKSIFDRSIQKSGDWIDL